MYLREDLAALQKQKLCQSRYQDVNRGKDVGVWLFQIGNPSLSYTRGGLRAHILCILEFELQSVS